MTNLQLFYAAQKQAAEGKQLRLRAILSEQSGLPVMPRTDYRLTIYVGGMPCWSCKREVEGRSNPSWIAEEMMGELLLNVLLTGFRENARRVMQLRIDQNNDTPLLPAETQPGELLPNG